MKSLLTNWNIRVFLFALFIRFGILGSRPIGLFVWPGLNPSWDSSIWDSLLEGVP